MPFRRYISLVGPALLALIFIVLSSAVLHAEGAGRGMELLEGKCAGCHDLKGPAADTLEDFLSRKGPDLFYAGIKYNEEWLEEWLVNPKRLRPAGFRYSKNIKRVEGEDDQVVYDKLTPHIALSPDVAKSAADTLMGFKANEELVMKDALTEKPADSFMGELNFEKFSGCLACHEIEPEYGGVTGPEVYTISKRLQPDFIYSYLKSPQSFDPKSLMPDKELSENFLQILTKYMLTLEEVEHEDEEEQ
jgi:cytochrome c2